MASADPFTAFFDAVERATSRNVDTVPAALATASADGRPSVRIVLVRNVDERGFVFHTNYNSRKGQELAGNMYAALCFHWPTLEEQIRIEGPVEQLSLEESDAYFAIRPRGSQIGAWARDAGRALSGIRASVRGRRDSAPAVLGRIPRGPQPRGVLVRPSGSAARSNPVHTRREHVADFAPVPLTGAPPPRIPAAPELRT
jgi:pyridoxamine 5'-phosphate oxidase